MTRAVPKISVIVPVYNEEHHLEKCLSSVIGQKYPAGRIELIVVDDGSTDATLQIAKKFGVKVVKSGFKNIERSKALGFAHATGKYVFFLDADNTLTSRSWFTKCVSLFAKYPDLVGVQSYKYKYLRADTIANRYCALMGINDPTAYYLGKRGQLKYYETKWLNKGTLVSDNRYYFLCRFNRSTLPTIGSQGYMTRRDLLEKVGVKKYLFHMDVAYGLVGMGYDKFAFIKYSVVHDYAHTLTDMLKKLIRNIKLYLSQNKLRTFKYDISPTKAVLVFVIMATGILPLAESMYGYLRKRDVAWFIHPILSVTVAWVYGVIIAKKWLRGNVAF